VRDATEAVEVEVQDDGSFVAMGSRDWQQALRDGASIRLAGSVADEDVTFDVYAIIHRDGIVRTYALPVA
jgi:hypothetical protein